MRLLGLDYGSRYIGVAISDEYKKIALIRCVLSNLSKQQIKTTLLTFIREDDIGKIIIGYPRSLAGKITKQTDKTQHFFQWLKNWSPVPVELFDERLTSQSAEKFLRATQKKKTRIDDKAAQIILQDYIDRYYA